MNKNFQYYKNQIQSGQCPYCLNFNIKKFYHFSNEAKVEFEEDEFFGKGLGKLRCLSCERDDFNFQSSLNLKAIMNCSLQCFKVLTYKTKDNLCENCKKPEEIIRFIVDKYHINLRENSIEFWIMDKKCDLNKIKPLKLFSDNINIDLLNLKN